MVLHGGSGCDGLTMIKKKVGGKISQGLGWKLQGRILPLLLGFQ